MYRVFVQKIKLHYVIWKYYLRWRKKIAKSKTSSALFCEQVPQKIAHISSYFISIFVIFVSVMALSGIFRRRKKSVDESPVKNIVGHIVVR